MFDKQGTMFFCGTPECMEDDMQTSLCEVRGQTQVRAQPKQDRFNLGSRYKNASLTNWLAEEPLKQTVINWLKAKSGFLIALGVPGCGKTHMCAAIGEYLTAMEVEYYNVRMYFEALQKAIQSDQNQYTLIKKIASKDYLMIDDIGSSTNTEWQKEVLFDLIDQRYSTQMPTVITSNYNQKEIRHIFGERFTRRIFNKDNFYVVVNLEEKLEF